MSARDIYHLVDYNLMVKVSNESESLTSTKRFFVRVHLQGADLFGVAHVHLHLGCTSKSGSKTGSSRLTGFQLKVASSLGGIEGRYYGGRTKGVGKRP